MDFEERLVSGAPREIYALPGSLFEFHGAVMDADRAARAGVHPLFELYGPAYYRHTPDADMIVDDAGGWGATLIDLYRRERHCHAAASMVLRIDDAVIDNPAIRCGPGETAPILYESFRFPDRAGDALPPPQSGEDVPFADFQQADRAYLYLGSLGSSNYGHWLVDDLPRAKAWLELRRRLGSACIVVTPSYGGAIDAVRVRSLQALIHPGIEVQFIAPDRPCRLRDLHYVTPVSFHPRVKIPAALDFLRLRGSRLPHMQDEPTGRLFVARRPPHSRAIVNFDELRNFLDARGFTLVEPETLDFAEQVALFRNARIVVGQMGAAMTNSLFCLPGTSLIYLAPVGWSEPFYLDLAAVGGQQYNILAGPPASDGPAHLSDFTVPLAPLHHRLAWMGIEGPAPA